MAKLFINGESVVGSCDKAENISLNSISGMSANNVQEGVQELNTSLVNLVKTGSETITTTANGNSTINLSRNKILLSAKSVAIDGTTYFPMCFYDHNNSKWGISWTSAYATYAKLASKTFTVNYWYLDI